MSAYSDNPTEQRAYQIGFDMGTAAGTWVFDGNTPLAEYERVWDGIEKGDPMVLDAYNGRYGVFGDEYSSDQFLAELGIDPQSLTMTTYEPLVTAWEFGSDAGFWEEVRRACEVQMLESEPNYLDHTGA